MFAPGPDPLGKHKKALGTILGGYLTLPGRISWGHSHVGFLVQNQFLYKVHTFNMRLGLCFALSIPKSVLMCVLDHFPIWIPNCVQVSIIRLLIWGEVEEFWGSLPSLLFHPLCAVYQYHWQQISSKAQCYSHHVWQMVQCS